jgi:hypothetical protein
MESLKKFEERIKNMDFVTLVKTLDSLALSCKEELQVSPNLTLDQEIRQEYKPYNDILKKKIRDYPPN